MKSINLILSLFIVIQTHSSIIAKQQSISRKPEILFCTSTREIRLAFFNESSSKDNNLIQQTKTPQNDLQSRSLLTNSCSRGLNYNLNENYIIWSNITSIYVSPLNKKSKNSLNVDNRKLLLKTNEVHKLSLDWVHNLLYFIDNGEIFITNVKDSKKKKKVLESDNKNSYYAIDVVVNPIESFIVWIEWDRNTFGFKIVKADQNGLNKKVLIDKGYYGYDSRLFQPCCLAIDFDSKRIYFIDNKLQTLESLLFNGKGRAKHLQSSLLAVTNSLDIYGDHVYWSNSAQNTIFKASKLGTNGEIGIVLGGKRNIECIRVLDISRQPKTENRCASAKCSDLCIPLGSNQFRCVCDKTVKNECQEYHNSLIKIPALQNLKSSKNLTIGSKIAEIVITESFAKSYPMYVFKCQSIIDQNTNQTLKMEWFTEDDIKFSQKFNKSPIAKNMTSDGNTIELKVSYPYVKKLKTFKCKASSQNNETVQGIYKVNVRQLPSNPKILSHSLSFAGPSKVYLTLQIENSKVEPQIDKYRIIYRGIFNAAYFKQEYSVDFDAIPENDNEKNVIYTIKLDVDYVSADLMAFKLYAHNKVGWSYPNDS